MTHYCTFIRKYNENGCKAAGAGSPDRAAGQSRDNALAYLVGHVFHPGEMPSGYADGVIHAQEVLRVGNSPHFALLVDGDYGSGRVAPGSIEKDLLEEGGVEKAKASLLEDPVTFAKDMAHVAAVLQHADCIPPEDGTNEPPVFANEDRVQLANAFLDVIDAIQPNEMHIAIYLLYIALENIALGLLFKSREKMFNRFTKMREDAISA